jgi:hypothetical protein
MFERLHPGYHSLFFVAAVAMSLAFAFGQADIWHYLNTGGIRLLAASAGLFPLIWMAGAAISITSRRVERPMATLWRMTRRRKRWLLRGTTFIIVVILFARAFSSFKTAIPVINPFWADPWLADLDRMTFGTDPWILTHAIFGTFGTLVLDRIYILWFIMMFLTLGWFSFAHDPKLQIRGLMCFLLSWSLLGGAVALGLSSVGPCFYEQFYSNDRFAPLMTKLEAVHIEHELFAFRSMQFLIDSLGNNYLGGGISAMPSLHVTMAMLSFLAVCTYSKSLLLKLLSGLFALAIMIGSVHLGWHYAWDGIFGIIAVSIFWWGSGRLVDWLEQRELRLGQPAPALPQSATALPATS